MRFVSPVLKRVVYPAMHYTGLGRCVPSNGCLVVTYHGVVPPPPYRRHPFLDENLVSSAGLRKQLRFLKTRYNTIDAETFRGWIGKAGALPPRSALVTCDDGLPNILSDMLPILQEEAVPCLFFVTGESSGEHPHMFWYEELYHLLEAGEVRDRDVQTVLETDGSELRESSLRAKWWSCVMSASRLNARVRAERIELLRSKCQSTLPRISERRWTPLNVRDLRQLARSSGMSIGAHTMSHPVLSQCSEDQARYEINESKAELEWALGQAVWAFAYPFGNSATMGAREVDLARQAEFECAFVEVGGGSVEPSQRFVLSRTHVTANMSLPEFEAHVSGLHSRLRTAFGAGT